VGGGTEAAAGKKGGRGEERGGEEREGVL